MDKSSEILKHHGILGMKWGVINKPGQGGRAPASKTQPIKSTSKSKTEEKKTVLAEDFIKARRASAKGYKALSDAELKQLNSRFDMEKKYKDYHPDQFTKAMNTVKTLTATATTIAGLYAVTKTPLGQDIIKLFTGDKEKAKK